MLQSVDATLPTRAQLSILPTRQAGHRPFDASGENPGWRHPILVAGHHFREGQTAISSRAVLQELAREWHLDKNMQVCFVRGVHEGHSTAQTTSRESGGRAPKLARAFCTCLLLRVESCICRAHSADSPQHTESQTAAAVKKKQKRRSFQGFPGARALWAWTFDYGIDHESCYWSQWADMRDCPEHVST